MKLSLKANFTRLTRKLRAWNRTIASSQREDLKTYTAEAARLAIRFTPPDNGRMSASTALAKLKTRIRKDFEGGGITPYDDRNIVWRTKNGRHYAVFADNEGNLTSRRPSPFRVIRGRVTQKKLSALQAGKHGVKIVGDIRSHLRSHSAQYIYKGSPVRLHWHGSRHLATLAAVRAEIRRRQARVGRLLAGWKPMARFGGISLPAVANRHAGQGYVRVRTDRAHGSVLIAHNCAPFAEMQSIIDKNIPEIRHRLRTAARRRQRVTAQKLRQPHG